MLLSLPASEMLQTRDVGSSAIKKQWPRNSMNQTGWAAHMASGRAAKAVDRPPELLERFFGRTRTSRASRQLQIIIIIGVS